MKDENVIRFDLNGHMWEITEHERPGRSPEFIVRYGRERELADSLCGGAVYETEGGACFAILNEYEVMDQQEPRSLVAETAAVRQARAIYDEMSAEIYRGLNFMDVLADCTEGARTLILSILECMREARHANNCIGDDPTPLADAFDETIVEANRLLNLK